VHTGDRIRR